MAPKRGKHPSKACWWPKPGGQSAERGAYGKVGKAHDGGDPKGDMAPVVGEPVPKMVHTESCSKGQNHSKPKAEPPRREEARGHKPERRGTGYEEPGGGRAWSAVLMGGRK